MARGRLAPPDLDDRLWQDLVDQARDLIPIYAPEWTDHNPSDLGMTLIELFAWLVEGMIYRLNQVPDKNFIEFLNLVGITRDPATPATTWLTYSSVPGSPPLLVARGNQVATPQTETEEAVVFESDQDVTILPINLTTALSVGKPVQYRNITGQIVAPPLAGEFLNLPAGQALMLFLGFDTDTTETITIRGRFSKPIKETAIDILWLYSQGTALPNSWPNIPTVSDGTKRFHQNGIISFTVPTNWTSQNPQDWSPSIPPHPNTDAVDQPLFWVGIRIDNLSASPIHFGLEHILTNSVAATNALTITEPEFLGVSNGEPFQYFELANQPMLKKLASNTPYDHLTIQVREPQGSDTFGPWTDWNHLDDIPKGAGNYFRLGPVTGTISFGNHHPTTSPDGHGSIPPPGSEIRALSYRYVAGGVKGNVPPDKLNVIRTPLAGLVGATNPGPATGGSDEEAVADTKRRGPEALRNRNRAVTVEDYEYLVREATTDVKKVRCLPPRLFTTYEQDTLPPGASVGDPWTFGGLDRSVGRVNVIIIPDASLNNRTPEPSIELIQEVSAYLEARRMATALLNVTGPRYIEIRAHVVINVWLQAVDSGLVPDPSSSTVFEDEIRSKIVQFLHPIKGGPLQTGWEVGEDMTISGLFEFIQPATEIGFIASLDIEAMPALYGTPRPPDFPVNIRGVWVQLADYEMVCSVTDAPSNRHDVIVNVV